MIWCVACTINGVHRNEKCFARAFICQVNSDHDCYTDTDAKHCHCKLPWDGETGNRNWRDRGLVSRSEIRPSCNSRTRSQREATAALCVAMIIVPPLCRTSWSSNCNTPSAVLSSRFPVGSSASISDGLCAQAPVRWQHVVAHRRKARLDNWPTRSASSTAFKR